MDKIEIIREIIGDKFFYEKKLELTIKDVKSVSGNIVVITSARTFNLYENEVDDFLDKLTPWKPKEKVVVNTLKKNTMKTELVNNSNDESLQDFLFKCLEKVDKDPDFVKQANAICNITSQLISIKKLELLTKNKLK